MGGPGILRVFAHTPDRVTALIGVSAVPASGVPFDEQSRALFEGAAHNDGNHVIIDFTTGELAVADVDQADGLVIRRIPPGRRSAGTCRRGPTPTSPTSFPGRPSRSP